MEKHSSCQRWHLSSFDKMVMTGQLVHYLNAKLTARGPAALPYDERLKMSVRDQLVAVVEVSARLRLPASEPPPARVRWRLCSCERKDTAPQEAD